jgi:fructokinase
MAESGTRHASTRICVVGESLIDLVDDASGDPPKAYPGGGPFNIAIGLARLGDDVTLLTQIGADEYGGRLHTQLANNGVTVVDCAAVSHPTSLAAAKLDAEGHASYTFDLAWDVAPLSLPEGTQVLHIGSLGASLEPGGSQVVELVERTASAGGVLISYDPNARPVLTPDPFAAGDRFWHLAGLSTVVKFSDEDLAFLSDGMDFETAVDKILEGGETAVVIMTRGRHGVLAKTSAGVVESRAADVTVADTVGAGDSFTAAFLHALSPHGAVAVDDAKALASDSSKVAELLSYASKAAGITVSRVGADPPTADEVEAAG